MTGKYKRRLTSRCNGSTKYRLISPEARAECLIDFILKKNKGMITTLSFWKLSENAAKKYHTSDCSVQRFWSKFIDRYITNGSRACLTFGVPKPIFVVNVNHVVKNKICSHEKISKITSRKRDTPLHDIFYLWMDDNNNTKIGITSSNATTDRTKHCARNRGTGIKWVIKFKAEFARMIEKEVLAMFSEIPYSSGDGWTEFRTMSDIEIKVAIDFARANGAVRI